MALQFPIRAYVSRCNDLERVNKEIKRRSKSMEHFPSQKSAEKYLYAILSEIDERFMTRRLNNDD